MTNATPTVHARIPAKVNLLLAVRGTRPDGYHEVVTVLQTIGIHDELSASLHGTPWACQHPAARKLMRVRFEHDGGPAVPTDRENLVVRAAGRLLEALGVGSDDRELLPDGAPLADERSPTTSIRLTKRIPVAGGMAGGSADAAAALLALDRLWCAELGPGRLREIAAGLGADVPFCLQGGSALATGTGVHSVQVLARGRFHWVVARPHGDGLSTPAVYAAWDELDRRPSTIEPDVVLHALRTGDVDLLAGGVHNDLADAALALRPDLADGLELLRSAGALCATVSGSGPTLLALAGSDREARAIADEVGHAFAGVDVVAGPAGGPRLSGCAPGQGVTTP